jgi:hypothetical protein
MSTTSFELGPVLVSDLPPVPARPHPLSALRRRVATRWEERRFERALRQAGPAEQSDLLALARRH